MESKIATQIKPETRSAAQKVYDEYKDIIDLDAKNGNPHEKAVALTFLCLAGYSEDSLPVAEA